jgi:hypothetical protein
MAAEEIRHMDTSPDQMDHLASLEIISLAWNAYGFPEQNTATMGTQKPSQ